MFPKEFANRLESMAGLRNRLVHLYSAVDPNRAHEFLQNDRADFDEFARVVAEYMQRKIK